MSCKLPESDTGIINPLKKHLDKINRDQNIRGIMGCSPFSHAVKCWRELTLKGKLQVSHVLSDKQTGEKGAVWETGLFQQNSVFKS